MLCGCRGPAAREADTARAVVAVVDTMAPAPAQQLDRSEIIIELMPVENRPAPADLLVTSPGNQRTGFDAVRRSGIAEIPHASYDSSPPSTQTEGDPEPILERRFLLVTPAEGKYRASVIGHRRGRYLLGIKVIAPSGLERSVALQGTVMREGEVVHLEFNYARADTGVVQVERVP